MASSGHQSCGIEKFGTSLSQSFIPLFCHLQALSVSVLAPLFLFPWFPASFPGTRSLESAAPGVQLGCDPEGRFRRAVRPMEGAGQGGDSPVHHQSTGVRHESRRIFVELLAIFFSSLVTVGSQRVCPPAAVHSEQRSSSECHL